MPISHHRFEPTDLELERPGVIELDLQAGAIRGPDASRLVAPDFEIDLGILPYLELDLDGAVGVEGAPTGVPRFFDHSARENLWASIKLGLLDEREDGGDSWALGIQAGPRFPIAPDAHGLGAEGLVLLGWMTGPAHVVGQVGMLVDPRTTGGWHPYGVEGGIDLELELVHDRWSLLSEIGGIWYGSPDADQLAFTFGAQYSPTPWLDVSIVGLAGLLQGSDPYGVLFGISPKLTLW